MHVLSWLSIQGSGRDSQLQCLLISIKLGNEESCKHSHLTQTYWVSWISLQAAGNGTYAKEVLPIQRHNSASFVLGVEAACVCHSQDSVVAANDDAWSLLGGFYHGEMFTFNIGLICPVIDMSPPGMAVLTRRLRPKHDIRSWLWPLTLIKSNSSFDCLFVWSGGRHQEALHLMIYVCGEEDGVRGVECKLDCVCSYSGWTWVQSRQPQTDAQCWAHSRRFVV